MGGDGVISQSERVLTPIGQESAGRNAGPDTRSDVPPEVFLADGLPNVSGTLTAYGKIIGPRSTAAVLVLAYTEVPTPEVPVNPDKAQKRGSGCFMRCDSWRDVIVRERGGLPHA